ncbi:MAG TPA: hypothetical protein VJK48_02920 [Chlamydiales bacterium]|nr:MAG: hypothetical protein A3F67_10310 [Verrucomicrobia bacterium RIFCSPHIGHO2_12_FULL_41_10]HLB52646.1 hypothetical protein [Chlamydiales bacterium]
MRPLTWLFFLFCLYIWVTLTGNEEMVIQRGKALYRIVVHWFEDAEIDFHLDDREKPKNKERSRRWD